MLVSTSNYPIARLTIGLTGARGVGTLVFYSADRRFTVSNTRIVAISGNTSDTSFTLIGGTRASSVIVARSCKLTTVTLTGETAIVARGKLVVGSFGVSGLLCSHRVTGGTHEDNVRLGNPSGQAGRRSATFRHTLARLLGGGGA